MIDEENYKGIERNFLYGYLPWTLSRGIPVFLALAFGGPFVRTAVDYMNTNLSWLSNRRRITSSSWFRNLASLPTS